MVRRDEDIDFDDEDVYGEDGEDDEEVREILKPTKKRDIETGREIKKAITSQPRRTEEAKTQFVEREITLSLLNDKLNYIINLLERK